jgi:hypothetical protein
MSPEPNDQSRQLKEGLGELLGSLKAVTVSYRKPPASAAWHAVAGQWGQALRPVRPRLHLRQRRPARQVTVARFDAHQPT